MKSKNLFVDFVNIFLDLLDQWRICVGNVVDDGVGYPIGIGVLVFGELADASPNVRRMRHLRQVELCRSQNGAFLVYQ